VAIDAFVDLSKTIETIQWFGDFVYIQWFQ
jgi:hypothetical protein